MSCDSASCITCDVAEYHDTLTCYHVMSLCPRVLMSSCPHVVMSCNAVSLYVYWRMETPPVSDSARAYYTIRYYTLLYSTILYHTLLYSTLLCYTILCYNILQHTNYTNTSASRSLTAPGHTLGELWKHL